MLPYWHGEALNFCTRQASESPAAGAEDGHTGDSADTDADWYRLDEDRLQRTPAEQRALNDQFIEEKALRVAHMTALELYTFPTWCDVLSADSRDCGHSRYSGSAAFQQQGQHQRQHSSSTAAAAAEVVNYRAVWRADFSMGDCLHPTPPPPPMPPMKSPCQRSHLCDDNVNNIVDNEVEDDDDDDEEEEDDAYHVVDTGANSNNGNSNNCGSASGGGSGQAVASGRSLADIEAAVEHTRNNSNQQQRYEMRGGHAVEICSRVDFPDRTTRDVSVTVEATHSNGCHRVIMLKGLTAKKRPDLGPKVKDCRLRMDQIVLTRPNTSTEDWHKCITMSYDSDFQVGLGEDRNRPL